MGLYCFTMLFLVGLFSKGLIIGENSVFQNGLGFTIKTANSNFQWAYIQGVGGGGVLLSERYLPLRFANLCFILDRTSCHFHLTSCLTELLVFRARLHKTST